MPNYSLNNRQNYAYIYTFVIFEGFSFLMPVYVVAFHNLFKKFIWFLSMYCVIIFIK